MNTAIAVATSIAPGRIHAQQEAVTSWQRLGWRVLAVNPPAEIDGLALKFPGVEFVPAIRDAGDEHGRHLVYLDDLIAFLRTTDEGICGIVNADVRFQVDTKFREFLGRHGKGGIVFGSRIDVTPADHQEGHEYDQGFDFFFFAREVADRFPPSSFCLGLPGWDYWLPMIGLLHGIPVRHLLTPVAFHSLHEATWSVGEVKKFERILFDDLSALCSQMGTKSLGSHLGLRMHEEGREFWAALQRFIDGHGEPLFIQDTVHGVTISRDRYDRLKASLKHREEELRSLVTSRSWRYSAPFRQFMAAVRSWRF